MDFEYIPKNVARPASEHISLGQGLRAAIFLIGTLIICFLSLSVFKIMQMPPTFAFSAIILMLVIMQIFISGLRVTAQWERAVILRLGTFKEVKGPGIIYVIPFIDYAKFLDLRVLTLNIPKQNVITKDNVPTEIDGVVFFKVTDAKTAIISIQDYNFAISQYAQNSLRDVIGGLSLDDVLSEREKVQKEVYEHIQDKVNEWGISVDSVRILDIQMPEDLKRVIARQASAEREKRATIIKAEGDKIASITLSEAAENMRKNPGAMELRTLQTIDGLGTSQSNTVVLFPVKFIDALNLVKRSSPMEENNNVEQKDFQ